MKRRLILALVASLIVCVIAGAASAEGTTPTPFRVYLPLTVAQPRNVLIAALHYDGIITGEPDEAFQLYNPNDVPVSLAGWQLESGSRSALFPAGLSLAAHGLLWCGREAVAFRRSFGHAPACEWAADTDPAVPDLTGAGLSFANSGGALALWRPDGVLSDALVYKAGTPPAQGWRGGAVYPYTPSSVFHEQGQVLYRKLDPLSGLPRVDTDTLADWASDPGDVLAGRRVRYAGWALDRFFRPAIVDEQADLQLFVAPDHSYSALNALLASAERSITFEGYTFESAPLAETVAQRAGAGVAVTILLEGAPPGGISNQQRWVVQRLAGAGAQVLYMRSDSKAGIHDRYAYQHAKLWLLDDRLALIGSENPSPDSFPNDDKVDGASGRRGVYAVTDAAIVVGRVRDIMAADLDPAFADIWRYDPADPVLGAPPPDFTPTLTSGGSAYRVRIPDPLSITGRFHFEVCQAPEHALTQDACLIGLVDKAGPGDVILVQQLSEPPFWGPSDATVESDPNPRLQAYLAAARRGATVRILLDAFFDDLSSSRSNLRTEEYLTARARAEALDLEVRRGNPTGLGLHNKMVLAEIRGQGWLMVGSLNGGEASAKVNREVSLVAQSDEAYRYLAGMFWGDWGN